MAHFMNSAVVVLKEDEESIEPNPDSNTSKNDPDSEEETAQQQQQQQQQHQQQQKQVVGLNGPHHSHHSQRKNPAFVSVSVVAGQAERWNIVEQAAQQGLEYALTGPFEPMAYPGYETRRNRTGNSFQNKHTQRHTGHAMQSEIYVFAKNMLNPSGQVPLQALGKQGQTTLTLTQSPSLVATLTCGGGGGGGGNSSDLTLEDYQTRNPSPKSCVSIGRENSRKDNKKDNKKKEGCEEKDQAFSSPSSSSSSSTGIIPNRRRKKIRPAGAFKCTHCDRSYTSERGRDMHIKEVHIEMRYGENWRGVGSSTSSHEPSLSGGSEGGKTTRRKTTMKKSMFICPECAKEFHDAEALWQHRVAKHSHDGDIRPQGPLTEDERDLGGRAVNYIPCTICGQAVPDHWPMSQHEETLKPLLGIDARCMLCDKSFTEHRALRQHLNFCRLRHGEGDDEMRVHPQDLRRRVPQPSSSVAVSR
eukprot:UC1_evm1s56